MNLRTTRTCRRDRAPLFVRLVAARATVQRSLLWRRVRLCGAVRSLRRGNRDKARAGSRVPSPAVRACSRLGATLEAPARARAADAAAREGPVAPRRGELPRARTEKQRAYERRRRQERTRKQKLAARLLGQGMTQERTALAVGVTSRTLRNWKAAPAFRRELERQHKHAARSPTSTPSSERRRPLGTPKSAPSGRPQRRAKQQPVQTSSAAEPPPAADEARPAQPSSGRPIRRPTSVALPSTAEPPSARQGFAGFLDRKDAERAARVGRAPGQPANSFLEPREWLVHQLQLAKVNRDPEREAVARQALADWDAQ